MKYTSDTMHMLQEKRGYRCPGVFERMQPIADIIDFEIEELGNEHLKEDMQKHLGVEGIKQLRKEYPEAKGIWLTSKKAAKRLYCSGEAPKAYIIPECAKIASDLGYDGALFLLPKGCLMEYG
jgi:hypothetical protein